MTTSKEDERTKAIRYYFEEYLKDPCIIWESISETACRSDEEAAKRVAEIALALKLYDKWGPADHAHLAMLAALVAAAFTYIMGVATARYDAEGAP